ncbi:hypothetical protein HHK36_003362 [Tetracentron sinense]|uniref:Cystatin domain-containing protein n=1 Tax=Tetracentron sinense TaxID=13715 RepID=A0A834ZNX7_TETSI|nr:hypothetical protein HHK36_003362 [Tetracentron sinense]
MVAGFSGATAGNRRAILVGGWAPIKDVKDPHVQEIGQFAVTEHNKEAKTELKYERVVRGETQVVAGANYRLVVAAKEGGVTSNYEAVVYERAWEGLSPGDVQAVNVAVVMRKKIKHLQERGRERPARTRDFRL